eukprot:gnl/Carplike_NY0171/4551_a6191_273.p1 GENE.gnl/Carplike_NY0171/4551_a6191_273~~gnl/Carplike_NY0171/4551_a6191_273.p1  ORF type:complete len:465 (+),score=120.36 gnl/Carplike_NY0171/4551_a6191_273:50-1444(+)
MKVACIEKEKLLGGTCLREGCIPSKALLHASHELCCLKDLRRVGININKMKDNVSMDVSKMMKHKTQTITGLSKGIDNLFEHGGITRIQATAIFEDPHTLSLHQGKDGEGIVKGDRIMVASGSSVVEPPFCKIDEEVVCSSTGALSFDKVPEHLVVIGGGVIGVELGSVWKRLGAKVTVIEYGDSILGTMDKDARIEMTKQLKKQGLKINTGMAVGKVTRTSDESAVVSMTDRSSGKEIHIECDKVLVACGRKPNTETLFSRHFSPSSNASLVLPDIKFAKRGQLIVDEYLQVPSYKHIFGIGDVVDGPMLAHKASDDAIRAVKTMTGRPTKRSEYSYVPGIVYTSPECASCGMTEDEAKALYGQDNVRCGVCHFSGNSRSKACCESVGFVKIVAMKEKTGKGGKVLGVHIVSEGAGEMIHQGMIALEAGMTAEELGESCFGHPSFSESVKEAALSAYDIGIHC